MRYVIAVWLALLASLKMVSLAAASTAAIEAANTTETTSAHGIWLPATLVVALLLVTLPAHTSRSVSRSRQVIRRRAPSLLAFVEREDSQLEAA